MRDECNVWDFKTLKKWRGGSTVRVAVNLTRQTMASLRWQSWKFGQTSRSPYPIGKGEDAVRVVPHGKELASHRDIAFSVLSEKNKLYFGLR